MNAPLGADTRRVDLIAEGLRGHSGDIQDLRTMAQRAVAEMRNAWAGPDFESMAQRWEQEAGPRLTDVSTALSTMATALRAQAEGQRQASGNTGGPSLPAGSGGPPGGVAPGGGGGGASRGGHANEIDDLDPDDPDVLGDQPDGITSIGRGAPESTLAERVRESVKLNFAQGGGGVDVSLASMDGGDDNVQYELSAGKVRAAAEYSVDLDAHGNLVASADALAAAYLGYAAVKAHGVSDFANGTVGGRAYVGAEARADASGSIGLDGASGHLGAAAFAGAKAEVNAGGTLAGVTAAAGAEISYGIGAHAEVDAELSATSVGVSVDVGAALGIGTGVKLDVSVNPQDVIANVGEVADDLGDAAEDVGRGLVAARDQVASFFDW